jgi:hypothetical protein
MGKTEMNQQVMSAAFQGHTAARYFESENVSAFRRPADRVVLNRHPQIEWTRALESRFNKLTSLPVGWDGYAGRPVSFTCARFAADLLQRLYDGALPPPSLVPGSDGSLQVEWHINQFDIEIDVLGAFDVMATRHDCLTEQFEEIELTNDFTDLARWITDLKVNRTIQQAA